MIVCAFLFMTWVQGVIVACVFGVIGYLIFQGVLFIRNDYYMPFLWRLINALIVLCTIVATFIASFFVGEFSIFMGFSISTWLLAFLLLCIGGGRFYLLFKNRSTRPIFISPWIFPIYAYSPKKQDVRKENEPVAYILIAIVVMIVWSVLATVWFYPAHAGVSLSILFESILMIFVIFLIQVTHLQMSKLALYIDQKITKNAWLDAKKAYIQS